MAGSILVSFAGTFKEAVSYCEGKPGLKAPSNKASKGDDGLPMLCYRFKNRAQYEEGSELLASLGWGKEFQSVVRYGQGRLD